MNKRGKSPGNRIGNIYYPEGGTGGEDGENPNNAENAGADKRHRRRGHRFAETAKYARAYLHKRQKEV